MSLWSCKRTFTSILPLKLCHWFRFVIHSDHPWKSHFLVCRIDELADWFRHFFLSAFSSSCAHIDCLWDVSASLDYTIKAMCLRKSCDSPWHHPGNFLCSLFLWRARGLWRNHKTTHDVSGPHFMKRNSRHKVYNLKIKRGRNVCAMLSWRVMSWWRCGFAAQYRGCAQDDLTIRSGKINWKTFAKGNWKFKCLTSGTLHKAKKTLIKNYVVQSKLFYWLKCLNLAEISWTFSAFSDSSCYWGIDETSESICLAFIIFC